MRISDLLWMCFRNLYRRKVRTILTVIGVVIGTCSIVVMVSLGVGLNEYSDKEMESYMDMTSITVSMPNDNMDSKKVVLDDKTIEDFAEMEHVEVVSPIMDLSQMAQINQGRFVYKNNEIYAMDLASMETFGYKVEEGSLATGNPAENGIYFGFNAPWFFVDSNSGILPEYAMDEDYHYIDPPPVNIMGDQFTISAVKNNVSGGETPGESSGDSTGEGAGGTGSSVSSPEDSSGAPQTVSVLGYLKEDWNKEGAAYGVCISLAMGKKLQDEFNMLNGLPKKGNTYETVKIKVDDYSNVEIVEETIKSMGYTTRSAREFREAMGQQAQLMQLVLGGLGAISLFVAALGITNTMIMSIYERTREIGVMKVLGCRLNDIRLMFLLEAGGIGFIGGIVGIILSYILSFALNGVVAMMMPEQVITISVIPLWLNLLGMGFAIGVGLIAGFSPANRAVKISPLAAIRQD